MTVNSSWNASKCTQTVIGAAIFQQLPIWKLLRDEVTKWRKMWRNGYVKHFRLSWELDMKTNGNVLYSCFKYRQEDKAGLPWICKFIRTYQINLRYFLLFKSFSKAIIIISTKFSLIVGEAIKINDFAISFNFFQFIFISSIIVQVNTQKQQQTKRCLQQQTQMSLTHFISQNVSWKMAKMWEIFYCRVFPPVSTIFCRFLFLW